MTLHPASIIAPQRARGALRIAAKCVEGQVRLDHLHQQGSARLLTTPARGAVEGVILNTSGGITGGDRFEVTADAKPNAHLRLTTQAAERIYRAPAGSMGQVRNTLTIEANARLDWLPQETILFDQASLSRKLDVDLTRRSTALIVEPLAFGRLAMGEQVRHATFRDRITLRRDGELLFRDAMHLSGDIQTHLDTPALFNGARAMGLILYAAPDAEAHLAPLRATLPPTAGVSLITPGLLVLRALASDSYLLRQTLIPALMHLTDTNLPRSWSL